MGSGGSSQSIIRSLFTAALIGLTSLALATLSIWLVPGYLILMTWMLWPNLVAIQANHGERDSTPEPSDRDGSDPSTTFALAASGQRSPFTGPEMSPDLEEVRPKRRRKSAAKKKQPALPREQTATAQWQQVAPGKFLRVETHRPELSVGLPHSITEGEADNRQLPSPTQLEPVESSSTAFQAQELLDPKFATNQQDRVNLHAPEVIRPQPISPELSSPVDSTQAGSSHEQDCEPQRADPLDSLMVAETDTNPDQDVLGREGHHQDPLDQALSPSGCPTDSDELSQDGSETVDEQILDNVDAMSEPQIESLEDPTDQDDDAPPDWPDSDSEGDPDSGGSPAEAPSFGQEGTEQVDRLGFGQQPSQVADPAWDLERSQEAACLAKAVAPISLNDSDDVRIAEGSIEVFREWFSFGDRSQWQGIVNIRMSRVDTEWHTGFSRFSCQQRVTTGVMSRIVRTIMRFVPRARCPARRGLDATQRRSQTFGFLRSFQVSCWGSWPAHFNRNWPNLNVLARAPPKVS